MDERYSGPRSKLQEANERLGLDISIPENVTDEVRARIYGLINDCGLAVPLNSPIKSRKELVSVFQEKGFIAQDLPGNRLRVVLADPELVIVGQAGDFYRNYFIYERRHRAELGK